MTGRGPSLIFEDDHARPLHAIHGRPDVSIGCRLDCAQAHIDKEAVAHPGEGIVPDAIGEAGGGQVSSIPSSRAGLASLATLHTDA